MNTKNSRPHGQRPLPCVIHLGFAGSRRLFDPAPESPEQEERWEARLVECIRESLAELKERLGLDENHFYCGISQIALGADMAFARALQELELPHRLLLPQTMDAYLAATGSGGTPDFTSDDQQKANRLAASANVIEKKVVSESADRSERFRETNAEIIRISDVVLSVQRANADSKAGGTTEFVTRAKETGKPALEIIVTVDGGDVKFEKQWHLEPDPPFAKPSLPEAVQELGLKPEDSGLPECHQFTEPLKQLSSAVSKTQQNRFKSLVAWVIACHFAATLLATAALALHQHKSHDDAAHPPVAHSTDTGEDASDETDNLSASENNEPTHHEPAESSFNGRSLFVSVVLLAELVLLIFGLSLHLEIHHSEVVRKWANARVISELARSARAVDPYRMPLDYLFRLPLPWRFRHLLRTMNVLHLRSSATTTAAAEPWDSARNRYLTNRIDHQREFYQKKIDEEKPKLLLYNRIFKYGTIAAIAATSFKLLLTVNGLISGSELAMWPQLLGTLAVVLPVLAVAALSWCTALDYQARLETYRDARAFLDRQRKLVETAVSQREFNRLVNQTEEVLLGEVTNWYSRRSNTSI